TKGYAVSPRNEKAYRRVVDGHSESARERLMAIGEIAAEVAHELRNALQIISANVYLAKQSPEKSLPFLAKIEKNARLAHGSVDDLMALARGEPAHAEPALLVEVPSPPPKIPPSPARPSRAARPRGTPRGVPTCARCRAPPP